MNEDDKKKLSIVFSEQALKDLEDLLLSEENKKDLIDTIKEQLGGVVIKCPCCSNLLHNKANFCDACGSKVELDNDVGDTVKSIRKS